MSKVPRIIHQIMHDFKADYPPIEKSEVLVPEKWKESPEKWKSLHPLWTYMLWGGFESRELIRLHYSWFLTIYDNYKFPIQRVDAIRYFILHRHGGIYTDLDLYPTVPIDRYISGTDEAYFIYGPMSAANSFIASTKGAIIWHRVFTALANVELPWWTRLTKHFTVMLSTGPMLLDSVIRGYNGTTGRLPPGFMNHELNCDVLENGRPILVALEGMSWCGPDTYLFNFFFNNAKALSFIGIFLIIFIIVLVVVFMSRSIKFKKLLDICSNKYFHKGVKNGHGKRLK